MKKVIRREPIPTCPDCGAKMVLRQPRPGQHWDPFWGCIDFPDCRGKRDILSDGIPADDYEDEWMI